jgi:uncharacterized membrane protein YjjP (DUF1212 family)
MFEIPKSINARFHDRMIDLEKVIEKARLIRKIEQRADESRNADEAEIELIREDITDLRLQIRQLDTDS